MKPLQALSQIALILFGIGHVESWAFFAEKAPTASRSLRHVHSHIHEQRPKELDNFHAVNATLFSRIQSDLAPWQEGISLEMVETTYCTDYVSSLRLQIVDGEVYILGEMEGFMEFHRMAKLFILDVYHNYRLPDVDLVLTTFDNCPDATGPIFGDSPKCKRGAPLFSFSRPPRHEHCVLWPTFSFGPGGWPLAKIPSWDTFVRLMNATEHMLKPWSARASNLFFRGAPTGVREEIMRKLHELDFGNVTMDARLTGWTGLTSVVDYVSLPGHCDYKYLLNLPGHGYASRLKYLMRCGSVPIFYDNGIQEFWYQAAEDNVHLVRLDVSNPADGAKAVWQATKDLEDNPQRAQAIAESSQKFVEQVLSVDNVQRYFVELLQAYSKLQTFQPQIHRDAVHIRHSAMGPDSTYTVHTRNCSFCKS